MPQTPQMEPVPNPYVSHDQQSIVSETGDQPPHTTGPLSWSSLADDRHGIPNKVSTSSFDGHQELAASTSKAAGLPITSLTCTVDGCSGGQKIYRKSELHRHLAKHTRPFVCPESGCEVKPFGDKAGLQRHRREVHLRNEEGKATEKYKCPKNSCKRHRNGFSRRSNMLDHQRRIHGASEPEPTISSTVSAILKDDGNDGSDDEMSTSASSPKCDARSMVATQTRNEPKDYASQSLRAELASLQQERATVLEKYDEKIDNVSRAISLLGRRRPGTL